MSAFTRFHLRLMGWIAVIWYGLNAADYTLTQMNFAPYTQLFPPEIVEYFTSMPAWIDGLWALTVWGGLFGAFLMASGARRSAALLALGPLGFGLFTIWLLVIARPPMIAVTGWIGLWIMLGSVAVSLVIWLYARAMHARGALA